MGSEDEREANGPRVEDEEGPEPRPEDGVPSDLDLDLDDADVPEDEPAEDPDGPEDEPRGLAEDDAGKRGETQAEAALGALDDEDGDDDAGVGEARETARADDDDALELDQEDDARDDDDAPGPAVDDDDERDVDQLEDEAEGDDRLPEHEVDHEVADLERDDDGAEDGGSEGIAGEDPAEALEETPALDGAEGEGDGLDEPLPDLAESDLDS